MRIYKKRPFNAPNSVRLNRLSSMCDDLYLRHRNLVSLKNRIAKGELTQKLYDFINVDGSLEDLLPGLPRPNDEISCEGLTFEQLHFIDIAIEENGVQLKQIMEGLWEAFREWWLDWWDVNRSTRITLQKLSSALTVSPGTFCSKGEFASITAPVYLKDKWEVMCTASKDLGNICKTIDEHDLVGWIRNNEEKLNKSLGEFGQNIDYPGPKLIRGNPKYDVNMTSLSAARWAYDLMNTYIKKAIDVLGTDIDARREFGKIEAVYKNASTPEDKVCFRFLKDLIKAEKTDAFVVANAIKRIMNAARKRPK